MKLTKLESLRGFAALYVMLSHLSSNYLHLQHSWIGQPFRFAQEGVLLFFLLSGFVIYYSWHEHSGKKDFGHFLYKRFRRIYPIFLLSMLLAWGVTCLHEHAWVSLDARSLFGNLFMTQGFESDPGWKTDAYMGNGPLWSLSYEWWFYMMFYPLYVYVPPAWQKAVVFVLAMVGIVASEFAPNIFFHILASFPIWWCGVEFAREFVEHKTFTLSRQRDNLILFCLTGAATGWVVYNWVYHGGKLDVIDYPLVKFRHYLVGIILILLFFVWRKTGFKGFAWTIGPFEIFAGMSYAIYVLHFPIICNLPLYLPASFFYLEVACRVALVVALAYLAEEIWQRRVNGWMDRLVWGKRTKSG